MSSMLNAARLFVLLLVLVEINISVAAPLTEENSAWNMNRNPLTENPAQYYGHWPDHDYTPSPTDWRDISIYHVLTDRFSDGDPSNNDVSHNHYNPADPFFRYGGDWKGLQNKLDYIQGMGFNAIMLSPVYQSGPDHSYHGYAPIDLTLVDPRLGTLQELRNLIDDAHSRGMYVLVDVVYDHLSNLLDREGYETQHPSFVMNQGEYSLDWKSDLRYEDFQPINEMQPTGQYPALYDNNGDWVNLPGIGGYFLSDFHHSGAADNLNDIAQRIFGKRENIYDDLRTSNPSTAEKIIAMSKTLLSSLDIDGVNIDTADGADLKFLRTWATEMRSHARSLGKENFFVMGEYYGSTEQMALAVGHGRHTSQPDINVFQQHGLEALHNSIATSASLGFLTPYQFAYKGADDYFSWLDEFTSYFDWSNANSTGQHIKQVSRIDAFEWARTISFPNEHASEKTQYAIELNAISPTIDMHYYATEQTIPHTTRFKEWQREPMFSNPYLLHIPSDEQTNRAAFDNFDMTRPSYLAIHKMHFIKANYPVVRTLENRTNIELELIENTPSSAKNIAFSYYSDTNDNKAIHIANSQDSAISLSNLSYQLPFDVSEYAIWVDVLDPSNIYAIDETGMFEEVVVPPFSNLILAPEDDYTSKPLAISKVQPAHDERIVESLDSIQLTFDAQLELSSLTNKVYLNTSVLSSAKLNFNDATNTLIISAPEVKLGINTIEIKSGLASTEQNILQYNFTSRFHYSPEPTIVSQLDFVRVDTLVSQVNEDHLLLQHDVSDATHLRVSLDYGETWTNWEPYQASTRIEFNIGNEKTMVMAEYHVDGSSAYRVIDAIGGDNLISTYPTLFLRGEFNDWAADTSMTLIDHHLWEARMPNSVFKLDVHGDWAVNFGDSNLDGTLEQNGINLRPQGNGAVFKINFNDRTRKISYEVLTESTIETLFIRSNKPSFETNSRMVFNPRKLEHQYVFFANDGDTVSFHDGSNTWGVADAVDLTFTKNGAQLTLEQGYYLITVNQVTSIVSAEKVEIASMEATLNYGDASSGFADEVFEAVEFYPGVYGVTWMKENFEEAEVTLLLTLDNGKTISSTDFDAQLDKLGWFNRISIPGHYSEFTLITDLYTQKTRLNTHSNFTSVSVVGLTDHPSSKFTLIGGSKGIWSTDIVYLGNSETYQLETTGLLDGRWGQPTNYATKLHLGGEPIETGEQIQYMRIQFNEKTFEFTTTPLKKHRQLAVVQDNGESIPIRNKVLLSLSENDFHWRLEGSEPVEILYGASTEEGLFQANSAEFINSTIENSGTYKLSIDENLTSYLFEFLSPNTIPSGQLIVPDEPIYQGNPAAISVSASDIDGDELSYEWEISPVGHSHDAITHLNNSGDTASVTFPYPGQYWISVVIKDQSDNTFWEEENNQTYRGVELINVVNILPAAPIVNITPDISEASHNAVVTFEATTTNPYENLSYLWSNGGTEKFGHYPMPPPGQNLNVSVAVTYEDSFTSTDEIIIKSINHAPTLNAAVTRSPTQISLEYYDKDNEIPTVLWDDGDTRLIRTFVHAGSRQTYTATISDQYGASATKDIVIDDTFSANLGIATLVISDAEGSEIRRQHLNLENHHKWSSTIWLPEGAQTYIATNNDKNYFGASNETDTLEKGSKVSITNIDSAGYYKITFIDHTLHFEIAPETTQSDPIADAGSDITIIAGQYATLSAVQSYDDDDDIVEYTWSHDIGNGEHVRHRFDTIGRFEVKLTVTDSRGATSFDYVTVTVNETASNAKYQTMHIAGSHNNWSVSATPMYRSSNDEWLIVVDFPENAKFKFVPRSWALSFGDNDKNGVTDSQGGGNIELPQSAGQYSIRYNDNTGRYYIHSTSFPPSYAEAGEDITLKVGEVAKLNAASPTEVNTQYNRYYWSEGFGSGVSVEKLMTKAGTYIVELEKIDSNGQRSTDHVTVTVVNDTKPQIILPKEYQYLVNDNPISISATITDINDRIDNLRWAQTSGPSVEITNSANAQMEFQHAGEGTYEFLLTAYLKDGTNLTAQTVVYVAPESMQSNHETMHIAGNFNSWSVSKTPMTLIANHLWEAEIQLVASSNMKFVPKDWSLSFGDQNADGTADTQSRGNIAIPGSEGEFTVQFNDQTLEYSITKVLPEKTLSADAGNDFNILVGENVRFDASGSTAPASSTIVEYLWSNNSLQLALSGQQPTYTFETPGNYLVTLTITDSDGNQAADAVNVLVEEEVYESEYSSMHLAGSHNGWNVSSTPMTLVDHNVWAIDVSLDNDGQFKFVPKDWSRSYGDRDADGTADSNGGGNIKVPSAGSWKITFNDKNKTYALSEQP